MPPLSRADWRLFSLALAVTCGIELTLAVAFSMLLRLAPAPPFMLWSYEVWSPGLVYLPVAVVIFPIVSISMGLGFLKRRLHPKPAVAVIIAFVGAAIATIVALWFVMFWVMFWVQRFMGQADF